MQNPSLGRNFGTGLLDSSGDGGCRDRRLVCRMAGRIDQSCFAAAAVGSVAAVADAVPGSFQHPELLEPD